MSRILNRPVRAALALGAVAAEIVIAPSLVVGLVAVGTAALTAYSLYRVRMAAGR